MYSRLSTNQKVSALRKCLFTTLILSLVLTAGIAANAAVSKKPAKPVPKKPPAATVQLAGDNGVFGTVYSIGKQSPIYFRLKSADFTTDQIVTGDRLYVPKANEKLLILHFTIQNPQKTELFVRWDSLRFTAVDKTNNNCEGNNDWGDEDDAKHRIVSMSLKPAQTVNVFTPIVVPADGIVPKLMVLPASEGDGPVLRYDLKIPKNKVTPLTAPVADPADTTGSTALETVTGVVGTSYPYESFDITVEKFEYSTETINDVELDEGAKFMLITLLMKNAAMTSTFFRWDTVTPVAASTDGEEYKYNDMLFATANRSIAQEIKPNAEIRVRLWFTVPSGSTPKSLSLKVAESRTYQFEVK